ncbi:STAS domain-containing protein [Catellatospora bangladeshensis]|uniref:STAS domain-containing protein n=1 Tax=Catellatospora bangladeshensis TaxID=310355 RepID=UPI001942CE13|nr:STAS domain-containing protein [Catellatospora bangladeshensis]
MTSQLSHQVEYDQNVARVHLTGEIDLAVADQLYELLVSAAGQRPGLALQVDMKAVTFTDSSGVHALVRSRAHPGRRRGTTADQRQWDDRSGAAHHGCVQLPVRRPADVTPFAPGRPCRV